MKTKTGQFLKILILILLLYLCVWAYCKTPAWPLGSELVIPGPAGTDTEDLVEELDYHGILFATLEPQKGRWFFWRDGERCWIKLNSQ